MLDAEEKAFGKWPICETFTCPHCATARTMLRQSDPFYKFERDEKWFIRLHCVPCNVDNEFERLNNGN